MGLDDSSCDTVLVLGLPLSGGTRPPVTSSSSSDRDYYARRRLQLKQEVDHTVVGSSHDGAPKEPSLTLALSEEGTCYGVAGKERETDICRSAQGLDYNYSCSSTRFPYQKHQQQHHHLQYTSCHSLSLSSASTFSNSCLSSGAAVKRERVDAGGHQPVVTGEEAEGDVDKALEAAPHAAASAAAADELDGDTAVASARKKLRLTKEQSALLEDRFKEQSTLNPKQKLALAKQLNLRPRQVEVWFQNRRARTKLKQTEVDCEFLRRCCETLADENRRLNRELQELKAINLTSSTRSMYLQIPIPNTPPPTAAFTMCPGCQRVTAAAGTDAANQTAAKATATAAAYAVAPKSAHVM